MLCRCTNLTDKQTNKHIDAMDNHIYKQLNGDTDKQTDRWIVTHINRSTETRIHRAIDNYTYKHLNGDVNTHTNRWISTHTKQLDRGRFTDRHMNNHAYKQRERDTDIQTHRMTVKHTNN